MVAIALGRAVVEQDGCGQCFIISYTKQKKKQTQHILILKRFVQEKKRKIYI